MPGPISERLRSLFRENLDLRGMVVLIHANELPYALPAVWQPVMKLAFDMK